MPRPPLLEPVRSYTRYSPCESLSRTVDGALTTGDEMASRTIGANALTAQGTATATLTVCTWNAKSCP